MAQLAFVWLVPLLGPILTLGILRKEQERGPGVYRPELDDSNIDGRISHRRATSESSHHDTAGESHAEGPSQ